ncbi:hypothetical protein EJB05_16709, partial [Eragrostis curvula]
MAAAERHKDEGDLLELFQPTPRHNQGRAMRFIQILLMYLLSCYVLKKEKSNTLDSRPPIGVWFTSADHEEGVGAREASSWWMALLHDGSGCRGDADLDTRAQWEVICTLPLIRNHGSCSYLK